MPAKRPYLHILLWIVGLDEDEHGARAEDGFPYFVADLGWETEEQWLDVLGNIFYMGVSLTHCEEIEK